MPTGRLAAPSLCTLALLASLVPATLSDVTVASDNNAMLVLVSSETCSITLIYVNGTLLPGWTAVDWLGTAGHKPVLQSCRLQRVSGGVIATRQLSVTGDTPAGACCAPYDITAVSVYLPSSEGAIQVRTIYRSASATPWRTEMVTEVVGAPAAQGGDEAVGGPLWWAPDTGPSKGSWTDPTPMLNASVPAKYLSLGYDSYGVIGSEGRVTSVPLTVHAGIGPGGEGLAVLLAPNDTATLLGVGVNVSASGSSFQRFYSQLGGSAHVMMTSHLIPLMAGETDWRPALGKAVRMFPDFFLPKAAQALERLPPVGMGVYTCSPASAMNLTQVRNESGATHIWDAHFWWPYIGMFLPPADTWRSNLGSGEQAACGNFSHGDVVSRATINQSMQEAANHGLQVLSYFNLFEVGQNVRLRPAGSNASQPGDWANSSAFISSNLSSAVILKNGQPLYTWQNAISLDPADPAYRQFLVDQAQDKVTSFGDSFNGIVIDRTDHTGIFRMGVADDISNCGGPCRSMLPAWKGACNAVSNVIHTPRSSGVPRLVLLNMDGSARIDLFECADGVFTEGGMGPFANAVALLATQMPAVLWTYPGGLGKTQAEGDLFMQRHLYLGLQPMAPVAGADHSILPGAAVQEIYRAYGPLFLALRNAPWWLVDGAATLTSGSPLRANAFVRQQADPSARAILVFVGDVVGGSPPQSSVTVVLGRLFAPASAVCQALLPFSQGWVATNATRQTDGRWAVDAPTSHNAVLVRCPWPQ